MHRKRVLYIQEGMEAYGRLMRLTADLDADFELVSLDNLAAAVDHADLVIRGISGGADDGTQLEQLLKGAENVSLLLVVDDGALKNLRLPAHVHADFAMANASDDELLIRMRHLLWPGEENANADFLSVDSMLINLSTYQVLVDGNPVDFTYLEYALLAFLVTHSGHVYSRDALLSRVWGFDYFGGSRTVDVHVRRVRSKLGNDLASHLRTVRGVGYMWE